MRHSRPTCLLAVLLLAAVASAPDTARAQSSGVAGTYQMVRADGKPVGTAHTADLDGQKFTALFTGAVVLAPDGSYQEALFYSLNQSGTSDGSGMRVKFFGRWHLEGNVAVATVSRAETMGQVANNPSMPPRRFTIVPGGIQQSVQRSGGRVTLLEYARR